MDYYKAKKIYRILFVIVLALLFSGYFLLDKTIKTGAALMLSGLLLHLGALLFSFKYLRCPHCSKRVSSILKVPYCPYCGNEID